MTEPQFSISDVPSLDASQGAVHVDIGYLADDDHLNAFLDIFEKFVQDNQHILRTFERVGVEAEKPIHGEIGNVSTLTSKPREVARTLYASLNDEVHLALDGPAGKRVLAITFDNPSFKFV
jgi:hypothetical protein